MPSRHRLILFVLCSGVLAQPLLQALAVPTLPRIQQRFDTDQSTAAWVLTAFLLTASVAAPVGGRAGDAFGKTRVLAISLGLLAVGSLAAAAAGSIGLLIAARAVQGLGGGAVPLSFAILRDHLPRHRLRGAVALTSSLLSVGFAAGIVVAGPILDGLGYRWLFLLPAIAAVAGAVAVLWLIPESPVRSGARITLTPALLLAGWLVTLLLGVSRGPHDGWSSPWVLGLLTSSVALAAAWLYSESKVRTPLIDLRMMATRGVWSANLVALTIGIAMYGSFVFLPQFTQTPSDNGYGFGASVTAAGQLMLPSSVVGFLCGLSAARLAAWLGVRLTLVYGSLATAVSLAMVTVLHAEVWQVVVASCVCSAGTGVVFANLANATVDAVPAHQTGTAIGMNANIRIVGGAIGSALGVTILTADLLPSGYPTERGYVLGFAFMAGASLVAGLAALLIPPSVVDEQPDPQQDADATSVPAATQR
ncbi:MFS transporter [Dactylosporangium sp. AC04546]|uniref:MFS transporter n=1 Tax=Dactylosporangium sp. AC04546 TaxID=2862460 RepID=UPI001EDE57A7|nr:MFS transporter [Dactylosporangium sp. AC04546]WVK87218.1 MFS transporter [Dactylosporangium sp. AC04546]